MSDHSQTKGRGDQEGQRNYNLYSGISEEEVGDALRKMKSEKRF